MKDKEIIGLFFARDELALEETEKKYGPALKCLAKNILKDCHEAGECYNDMLLGAWNRIPPEEPENLFAYLARIIRNIALDRQDYYHAKKRNMNIVELTEEIEECIVRESVCSLQEKGSDMGQIISAFLRKQKYLNRVVFVRRYWYGDEILQIAERMNLTESRVKSILFRMRHKLKEYLEREGKY